jgi:hypothetical protein
VQFLSRGPGYSLLLRPDIAVLVSGNGKPQPLSMRLAGANPAAEGTGIDALPAKTYYFVGNDPRKWRTKVTNYQRIRYRAVYPGIDLLYYGNQGPTRV